MIGTVALESRKIEAFEDAEREQKLETFAGRRRHMHLAAAIGDSDRLLPARRDRFEVGHRHVAAERFEMRDDRLPKRAAIEILRALRREAFERGCKVGLLQHASGLHA